jgi:hypothetical protein
MNYAKAIVIGIASATIAMHATAGPSTFRCEKDLVHIGDAKASALLKCGEPVVKDTFCKPVEAKDLAIPQDSKGLVVNVPCETVDEWTYNPGVGQFLTTLRFESGKLVTISYGKRVK